MLAISMHAGEDDQTLIFPMARVCGMTGTTFSVVAIPLFLLAAYTGSTLREHPAPFMQTDHHVLQPLSQQERDRQMIEAIVQNFNEFVDELAEVVASGKRKLEPDDIFLGLKMQCQTDAQGHAVLEVSGVIKYFPEMTFITLYLIEEFSQYRRAEMPVRWNLNHAAMNWRIQETMDCLTFYIWYHSIPLERELERLRAANRGDQG